MEESNDNRNSIIRNVGDFTRKLLFGVLSVGPIPDHIAFIMDGNRRYAKKCNIEEGAGHKLGYTALMAMLKYCYELNIKHVTIYAFSIDNFKRRHEEVQSLMELLQDKIESLIKEESIVNRYGIRVRFVGDLMLLDEPVRLAAERAMAVTANNSKAVLSICIAYTSTNEITHAVQQSCQEKRDELKMLDSCGAAYGLINGSCKGVDKDEGAIISSEDVERHMYAPDSPGPDILIRTSGETRLSNFLLWQSAHSILYSPSVLWPEIGLPHLVWAILVYQINHSYLDQKKKQLLKCL